MRFPRRAPGRLPLVAISLAALLLAAPAGCSRRAPLPGQPAASTAEGDSEAGGLRFVERLTGGARAADRLPLIIGIHGRGGAPQNFGQVLSALSIPARVILPYGPEPRGWGYTWFPDWNDDDELAAATRKAADRLAAMIDELVARRPTAGKPIVTGFSQGGMLSFTLAVLHPEVVGAAFPAGGLLPRPLWPATWPPGSPRPTVHAFHGAADDLVAVEDARGSVRRLADLGFSAELTEYPGVRHRIPEAEARDLVRAIEDAARRAASQ
jgi:phospholipase/carboxylesterase